VNWTNCVSGLTDANDNGRSLFIAPFAMNPENSSVLAAGSDKVWITGNSAGTWTQSSDTLSANGQVSSVCVVNATANYLGFAGTTDGRVFKCVSLNPAAGTDVWTEVTPPGNNGGWVRRIVVDLTDKNKVYATYGGYNASGTLTSRHIWYSTNQGTNWNDISAGLPNVPVHSLAVDPTTSTTLYAGTETGVYQSTNSGGAWTIFNAGMPWYVPTDELVVQKDTKSLFAFTHGRGVFTISLVPTGVENLQTKIPTEYVLNQNYPNPFNPTTHIRFTVPLAQQHVTLKVFDVAGKEVTTLVNEVKDPGEYTVQWDGAGFASGIYFYTMQSRPHDGGQAGSFFETKKMLLMK